MTDEECLAFVKEFGMDKGHSLEEALEMLAEEAARRGDLYTAQEARRARLKLLRPPDTVRIEGT